MRTRLAFMFALASVAALGAARNGSAGRPVPSRGLPETHESHGTKVLAAFDSMYGVDGPFVGDAFPIRDIPGDELPWTVREAKGQLDADGHLTIRVRGLVFTDDPEVPPEFRGKNDETQFRGAVSCLTEEGDAVTTANVITQGFTATPSGDSTIRATVTLPNPCVAPIVLILAGSELKWFAVAGFESEGDGGGGD